MNFQIILVGFLSAAFGFYLRTCAVLEVQGLPPTQMPHNLLPAFPVRAQCLWQFSSSLEVLPSSRRLGIPWPYAWPVLFQGPTMLEECEGNCSGNKWYCQYLLSSRPLLLLALAVPWKYYDTWFPSLCLPGLVVVSGLFSRSLGKKTDKGHGCSLYTSHVFLGAFLSPLLLYKLLKLRPKSH